MCTSVGGPHRAHSSQHRDSKLIPSLSNKTFQDQEELTIGIASSLESGGDTSAFMLRASLSLAIWAEMAFATIQKAACTLSASLPLVSANEIPTLSARAYNALVMSSLSLLCMHACIARHLLCMCINHSSTLPPLPLPSIFVSLAFPSSYETARCALRSALFPIRILTAFSDAYLSISTSQSCTCSNDF